MNERSGGRGGALLAGLALALCCGLPLIIASGALAVAGGWLARAWPVLLLGIAVLAYAGVRIGRNIRERQSNEVGAHEESRRR